MAEAGGRSRRRAPASKTIKAKAAKPASAPRPRVRAAVRPAGTQPESIVGIGASAGGLEALRTLVAHLDPASALAYVVVQHLSTTHESMLVTLLARECTLRVVEIVDGLDPLAGMICVAPAGVNVALSEGKLRLVPLREQRAPKPSVDEFFASLAQELGERAIGVVLSGTGSDGARGVRAIRAAGGVTFAQVEGSARYAGMPHSAIETGCIDWVLTPEEIARRLAKVRELYAAAGTSSAGQGGPNVAERIGRLLKRRTGLDLGAYKESTIQRRLRRRLVATQCATLDDYETLLEAQPEEIDRLAQEILISVTSFFREPAAFAELGPAVASIIDAKPEGADLRVWVPGCASGEEAYSVAMLVADTLAARQRRLRVQIFATDVDQRALAHARRGVYGASDVSGVPEDVLRRHFVPVGDHYQIDKKVRETVILSAQNLTCDPPFLRLDLVSCRNVLIYFQPEVQQRLLETFNIALVDGGILFLGRSEATYRFERLFIPLSAKQRVYRRLDAGLPRAVALRELAPRPARGEPSPAAAREKAISDRVLDALQSSLLRSAALVDERLELKRIFGDISPFARLAAGEANLNLYVLAHKDLRLDIRSMVMTAQRDPGKPIRHRLRPESVGKPVELTVVQLPSDPAAPQPLFLVVFETLEPVRRGVPEIPVEGGAERDLRLLALEEQLVATREHLHTVVEELETSNEELQSLNEELQSANEELQSSNEELETANEELQSTNEELTTVNEELEAKTHELIAVNNDLRNVKDNLDQALVVVDEHHRIVLVNRPAAEIFPAAAGAIGQLLIAQPCNIDIGFLRGALARVLEVGAPLEHQVDGERSYRVTLRPYLDDRGRRRGVVIAFLENTVMVAAEARMRAYTERITASERFANATLDALQKHVCVIDRRGAIVAVNLAWRRFAAVNGGTEADCGIGVDYVKVCERAAGQGDVSAVRFADGLAAVLAGTKESFSLEYPCHGPQTERWFAARISAFPGEGERYVVVTHEDITQARRDQHRLRLQSRALDASLNGICISDVRQDRSPIIYVNKAFEEITGYAADEAIGMNDGFLAGPDAPVASLGRARNGAREGKSARVLLRNYRKDGTLFWNEYSVYPIEDDAGAPAYRVSVIRDVTALVTSEEALKATIAHEKLALTFANVGSCDWELRSGRVAASDIFMSLLGLPISRQTLAYARWRELILAEDRPLFEDAVKVCIAGHSRLDVEYRVRWADDTVHWLHTQGDATPDNTGVPQRLLCLTQDVTERRAVDERVRYIAHHDALTGLPNRTLLRDRLQQAINAARRSKGQVGLLFIDLDHFKNVNDSLGHQVGDQLLQSVAERIRGCVRDTDTLCRQSGDEYLLVLPSVRDEAEVAHVAAKILDALAAPHLIESHELNVTPSIGISLYPDDGQEIDQLIRNADAAMYHAKGNGRANFQFFEPEMRARAVHRLTVSSALRRGLGANELALHYQPVYDVGAQRLVGVEALVRWRRGPAGLEMPDAFVPIAEESELIIALGQWVLNEACRQHREWLDAGLAPIPISVNFSPAQFRHKSVIETIARALKTNGLPPSLLEIEVTERAIMSNSQEAATAIAALRGIGLRVAVDDFGVGYSNLANLMHYSIDTLKIDRSFVGSLEKDAAAAAIVRAIIHLGTSMKLHIVAEGVETAEQLDFLRREGCSAFQGFYRSRALSAEEFAREALPQSGRA